MQEKKQNISPLKQKISQYVKYLGVSKREFYLKTGISRGTLENHTGITEDTLTKFLKTYPEINTDWLFKDEGSMLVKAKKYNEPTGDFSLVSDTKVEYQSIPLYDIDAYAGLVPLFKNGTKEPLDHISIPGIPKCDGAIHVTGDSMYPILKSGDIVLYKKINNIKDNIFFGEMYLVSIDMDGEEYIAVKYINKSDIPDNVKLVSYNKYHTERDVPLSKIRALAFVKASIRINTMN